MTVKKLFLVLLVSFTMVISISCKKKEKTETDTNISQNSKASVGIAVIVAHPALDAIQKGIIDELNEQNINADIEVQNASGEMSTLSSIANKFAADKKDVSVGIATPTAVALANSIKDKPVVFATVNDPIGVGLVDTLDHGKGNVTGSSDLIPIKEHLEIFHKIYPFQRLGLIYNGSERNSVSMAETTKVVCDDLGIKFVASTISNSNDVKTAAQSLVGRVDAFYIITDNTLVAGLAGLLDVASKENIPVFSEDFTSSKDGGVLYTIGFDYYQAGRKTGKIVVDILNGKKPEEIPVATMTAEESITLLNKDIAKKLKIPIPAGILNDRNMKVIENGELK